MGNLALYRKYRSRNFDEVVGQQHVVQTLKSAIKKGRVSHAYLFTGPRGVGKTSVARILAREINQVSEKDTGLQLDIIEIDAASNRSIDEVRDLRDKINLAPSQGKFKVYIIDEVHMLTKEAFNALLKTLEEPPAHAVFILATTEAHKLPETVISRTQRFNFRPISQLEIASHLKQVAGSEKLTVDEAAVNLLAQAGGGSLRDSLSLLDQIASLEGKSIDAQSIRLLLGWSDSESIDEIIIAAASGNVAKTLNTLDRVIAQGSPPGQIIAQLSERARQLLLISAGVKIDSEDKVAPSVLEHWGVGEIANFIESLITAAKSTRPALALEATLAKLAAQHASLSSRAKPRDLSDIKPPKDPSTPPHSAQDDKPVREASTVEPKAEAPTSEAEPIPKPETQAPAARGDIVPEKALEIIKQYNHSLYALVRACDLEIIEDQVIISCRFSFHYDRLREEKNRALIEQALSKTSGGKVRVDIQLKSTPAPKEASSELISSALDILGGEVIGE